MNPTELSRSIKARALELGFDLVGIAPAVTPPHAHAFDAWEAKGYAGSLDYLVRRREELLDPRMLLSGVRCVVSCAVSYRPDPDRWPLVGKHPVSCYAWGWDYHWVLKDKLRKLALYIEEAVPGSRTRCFTDSGPLFEKPFAQLAGLGFIGKHTLLVNPDLGSFLFLGEVATDAELPFDERSAMDGCGDCRRCMDACPTGALTEPRVLDARRCVSYRTQREDIPPLEEKPLNGMLWGCDLCQAACPYNEKAPPGREEALHPHPEILGLTREKILSMQEADLKTLFKNTALGDAPSGILKRNAGSTV